MADFCVSVSDRRVCASTRVFFAGQRLCQLVGLLRHQSNSCLSSPSNSQPYSSYNTPPSACCQAKSGILERTGSALDPERLKALAIAVASSAQPSVTLGNACQSLLDGMDVSDVLDSLLDAGKDDKKGAKGSKG